MKIGTSRKLLFTSLAIVFLSMLSGLLVNLLTNNPDFTKWLKDNRVQTQHLVFGVIITGIGLLLFAYLQFRYDKETEHDDEGLSHPDIEPDVKRFVDSLRERYRNLYDQKLDGRFEITLEVSENPAGSSPRQFSEKYEEGGTISPAFEYIRDAFDRKGRLLISGNPGAGKTVLLLRLASDLLNKSDFSKMETFPVIFNLVSWSENYKNFRDWLIATLVSGYGLSRDFAETLLKHERIVLLLDGLDELARTEVDDIAANKRAKCLESINNYLQRGRRVVISCRMAEFEEMRKRTTQEAPVAVKVAVLDLSEKQIRTTLLKASDENINRTSAENLLKIIDEDKSGVFIEVLCIPFYFITALDVFDRQIFSKKEFPASAEELKNFLIAEFIKRKLENTENPDRFKFGKTFHWLRWFARFLEREHKIKFELSDLQPGDLRRPAFFRVSMALFTGGVICPLAIFSDNPLPGLVISLVVGAFGAIGSLKFVTEDIRRWDFSELFAFKTWLGIFNTSLLLCLFYGILSFLLKMDWFFGVLSGVFVGLFYGLRSYCRKIEHFSNLKNPYQRLRAGFFSNLLFFGLTFGIFIEAVTVLRSSQTPEFSRLFDLFYVRLFLLGFLLGIIVRTAQSPFFKHCVLRLLFSMERAIPLKFVTFLHYASKLRILEREGGFWRFRHQNLQEYFINMEIK
jgi:DNA polymerase III delta prime subunit